MWTEKWVSPAQLLLFSLLSPGGHSSAPLENSLNKIKIAGTNPASDQTPQGQSLWEPELKLLAEGKTRNPFWASGVVLFYLRHFPGAENNIWEQNVSNVFTGTARNVGGGETLEASPPSAPCGFSEPCLPVQQGEGEPLAQ